jgi:tellurite resistance protein TehA-like permease
MRLRLIDLELSPDVFAAVMATGIVSVSAEDHRYLWISAALAGVGILALVVMTAMVMMEHIVGEQFPFDLSDPDVAVRLLTFVAACAVLGARLEAHPAEIWTLAAIAWLAWLVLAPVVLRSMWAHRWIGLRDHATGAWELASVAISGLAIVTAHLALLARDRALLAIGIAMWLLGIAVYCGITGLILWRVAAARSDDIWRPHSWILMGGMAITTLAGDRLHHVTSTVFEQVRLADVVRAVTVVTWVVATVLILPLLVMAVRHLDLRFSGAWWSMVFPLGMYSTATYAMKVEDGWQPLQTASLVFFWIAATAWLAVAIAAVVTFGRAQAR